MSDASEAALEALAAKRLRIGVILTVGELIVYFGFILLVAFDKDGLEQPDHATGLSVGILLGVAGHPGHVGADLGLRGLGEPGATSLRSHG